MTATQGSPAALDSLLFQTMRNTGRAFDARYYPPDGSAPYACIVRWHEGQTQPMPNAHGFSRVRLLTVLAQDMPVNGVKQGGTFVVVTPDGRENERKLLVEAVYAYDRTKITVSVKDA